MQTFQTGQKSQLGALTPSNQLALSARVTGPAPEYDLILFGLDAQGKLSDDRYMVFYNQPQSPEGAVSVTSGARNEKIFAIDLSSLPPNIRRLTLAATASQGTFGSVDHAEATLSVSGVPLLTYRVTGRDFQQQQAVMLLDIYFKDVWRVGAVGQGFNGGLAALVNYLGGEVSDPSSGRPPPVSPPPVSPPPLSLQKITLDKQGQSARISLSKNKGTDPVRVNLNWDSSGGLFRARADLDLGCLYVMNSGDKGVVQALGNRFGSDRFEPFILLDKDDRTGAASDGENLVIFRPDLVHTVLIFAYIYEGTSDFTRVAGRLTLKDPRGNEITVRLSNPDMRRTFCAIASLENYGGELQITKEERYFVGHAACDEHYGFGFQWSAGSK